MHARWRAAQRSRLLLVAAAGICVALALTASSGVIAGASTTPARARTAAAPFPLKVHQVSLRKLHGRIVGTVTVINTGTTPVRATTGLLGLSRGGGTTGVLSFSVPALSSGASKKVNFKTKRMRTLPLRSGTYKALVCMDVYSQIQRFAQSANCLPQPSSQSQQAPVRDQAASRTQLSGAALRASLEARRRSSALFRRLPGALSNAAFDGGPWLSCRSPQTYSALVDGPHTFDVRAISPSESRTTRPRIVDLDRSHPWSR